MGTNTLVTKADGEIIASSDPNQYKTALTVDLVPRNSAGVPTENGGDLGNSSFSWKRANISVGYLNAGMIMPMHTYNNTVSISQGWFPCNGDIINEANYNSIHGAGSWANFILSSPLNGKHSPNLNQKYLTGAASTSQDGSSALTYVGNSGNTINISHTHTIPSHNHIWYVAIGDANTYVGVNSSSSTLAEIVPISKGAGANPITISTSSTSLGVDAVGSTDNILRTSNAGGGSTSSSLSSSQSIRPHSLEVIYYIRII